MMFIATFIVSISIALAAAFCIRERNELKTKVAELSASNAKHSEEKRDLEKKLGEVDAEKSRLLSRILDWEKYMARLEPRMIDAEGRVAELTVLSEDSDAVIANLHALAETLYEMLDRYGNAKVSAEILQHLIDLLKKAQPKAAM
jgi:predicted  nucleic acid-binding Zn-ribbon protein